MYVYMHACLHALTVYVELQTRLKNVCEDRVEGRKTVAEFLRAVSHNIRVGQPNI